MKIAINRGVEDFDLSQGALCEKLIDMGWEIDTPENCKVDNGIMIFRDNSSLFDYSFKNIYVNSKLRIHADFIKLVENGYINNEMERCWGEEFNFVIVDVPDDVEWYIEQQHDEYCGHEIVIEKHRTWGGDIYE
jgi:hypothetical protein